MPTLLIVFAVAASSSCAGAMVAIEITVRRAMNQIQEGGK